LINPSPKPRRLSQIVESIDTTAPLSVGTLVDAFGERAFGALMFIFAVPNVIPTPPGTSAVLGLPLVILTFQLMIGRQVLWLPEAVRKRSISADVFEAFKKRAVPFIRKFEKVLKPRWSILVNSNAAERVIGLVTFILAVILFLPIPLVNILPAAAIAILSLGLAERDGIAVTLGYAGAAATGVLLTVVSAALYEAAKAFISALFGV
jgi:hypothetical protein